jgi:hypothetical protein
MRFILTFLLLVSIGFSSFAQKAVGYGGELSILSVKPTLRKWVNKTNGYEFFAGIGSELEYFKPNDVEVGFKYLKGIIYNRSDRTYFGVVGKWKWVNVYGSNQKTSLPIPGILIGKEWYTKRINRKGFAIELGYQYGIKEFDVQNHLLQVKNKYEEFPLILNLFQFHF